LLVITADHGDEFGDHGGYGHGLTVYQELVHVPLILVGPQVTQPGRRVGMPVPMLDLLPTLVDAAGAPMPDLVHGESLVPVLAGGEPAERTFYTQNRANRTANEQDALFKGFTKLIYTPLLDQTELYDLRTDPGEQHDLAAAEPERAATLRKELRIWERAVLQAWQEIPKAGVGAEEVDEATKDALKKIGY